MTRYAVAFAVALVVSACQSDTPGPSAPSPGLRMDKAAKSSAGISFESFGCDYELIPGRVWQTGDVLHIRGQSSRGLHLSTNSLVSGSIVLTQVKADINLVTGEGDFSGNLVLTPTALGEEGSWHAHFKGSIPSIPGGLLVGDPPTPALSHIVAHGRGVLAGRTLEFYHTANFEFAHPEFPSGCEWTGELFKGFVSARHG